VPIATGTKLGQYEVQDFIGQGAMGLVYRAYHTQLERTGAVKVMQAIAPDPDTVARFRHEALAIAQMRHPNIVDVYDFGDYQGTPYMIIEYVPGGSLANKMNQGLLEQKTAIRYLRGIGAGLDYAHAHGVVHRDVKPANVLLTADDVPVLADFGLAKLLQGSSLKSMTGMTTGTPAYMAPEQVTGTKVGPAADRYSLATIAYEMLTGYIPFDGLALMELLYAQVHHEPPLPSSRDASLNPRVDAVIMRGLAKDPADRWDSSTEFVDALAAALTAMPIPTVARTVVAPHPLASTVPMAAAAVAERQTPSPPPATAPPPAAPRKPRMGVRLAIAAGLIVALLLVAVIVWAAVFPPTTLALSSTTVARGDSVVVSASHVPPGQQGSIQLFSSSPHYYGFRADSNGNVSVEITVPLDIAVGDHVVKVCWNGACHAQQTLHVTARVAETSPTPTPSASASPSATPRSTPTASPTHASTPSPPPASPVPQPTPVITISSGSVPPGGTETVAGFHFTPGTTVTVSFIQGSIPQPEGSAVVGSNGSFSRTFTIPTTAKAAPASIRVCGGGASSCYFATVSIT
jgi:serine/threonine-protein kinase